QKHRPLMLFVTNELEQFFGLLLRQGQLRRWDHLRLLFVLIIALLVALLGRFQLTLLLFRIFLGSGFLLALLLLSLLIGLSLLAILLAGFSLLLRVFLILALLVL